MDKVRPCCSLLSSQRCSTNCFTTHWLSNLTMPLANKFYRQHGFRGKAKRNQPCAVVKNCKAEIVGCGYLRDYDSFTLLAGVAVATDYQNLGVARLLLVFLSQRFDHQTYTFPYLALLPFYQSLGFKAAELEQQPAVNHLYQTYVKQRRSIMPMVYCCHRFD